MVCHPREKGTTTNEEPHVTNPDLKRFRVGNDLSKCSLGTKHIRFKKQIGIEVRVEGVEDRAIHGGQNKKGDRW